MIKTEKEEIEQMITDLHAMEAKINELLKDRHLLIGKKYKDVNNNFVGASRHIFFSMEYLEAIIKSY